MNASTIFGSSEILVQCAGSQNAIGYRVYMAVYDPPSTSSYDYTYYEETDSLIYNSDLGSGYYGCAGVNVMGSSNINRLEIPTYGHYDAYAIETLPNQCEVGQCVGDTQTFTIEVGNITTNYYDLYGTSYQALGNNDDELGLVFTVNRPSSGTISYEYTPLSSGDCGPVNVYLYENGTLINTSTFDDEHSEKRQIIDVARSSGNNTYRLAVVDSWSEGQKPFCSGYLSSIAWD